VEDGADGAVLDAEFLGQFVDGGTSLVVGDELFGLVLVEPGALVTVGWQRVTGSGWLDRELWAVDEEQRVRVAPR
jgi:hypothetical protein